MDEKTAAAPVRTGRGRRMAALAGLLLAVGTAAACGPNGSPAASGSSSASPSATASASPTSGPGSSAPPTASVPVPASPAPTSPAPGAPTSPGTATGEPTPAKLPASGYQASDTQLTVFFFAGICDKYGLKADESTPGQVKAQIVVTQTAPRGQACPALVKEQSVTAQLKQPLGSRAVIDQSSGQPLAPKTGGIDTMQ